MAADKLGRTQSAISMALKQLEAELGAELFEPGRKDRLTALGKHTLGHVTKSIEHFDQSVQSIQSFAASKTLHIRIASVPSAAQVILPSVLEKLMQLYPDVHVELRDMDSASVIRELRLETVDIGIASNVVDSRDLDRKHLISDAFGIVCHPDDNLIEPGESLDWEKFGSRPFLANGLCKSIDDEGFQKLLSKSKLMVLNTGSLMAMVRNRMGITLLPKLLVGNSGWDLQFHEFQDTALRRDLYVVRRAAKALSQEAEVLMNLVFDAAKDAVG